KSTGSLSSRTPGPSVQPGLPLKVSAWSDWGVISESLARRATCAALIRTVALPNAFDRLIRTRRPGMLVRIIIRTVWLSKARAAICWGVGFAGCGGAALVDDCTGAVVAAGGAVRASICAVAHVETQWSCPFD